MNSIYPLSSLPPCIPFPLSFFQLTLFYYSFLFLVDKIHLLGREAQGPLARPFKSAQQRLMENIGAVDEEDEGGPGGASGGDGDVKGEGDAKGSDEVEVGDDDEDSPEVSVFASEVEDTTDDAVDDE